MVKIDGRAIARKIIEVLKGRPVSQKCLAAVWVGNNQSSEAFLKIKEKTAYDLFEDYVSGVSSESLGVPRGVLGSAADQPSMMLARIQYAELLEEKENDSGS